MHTSAKINGFMKDTFDQLIKPAFHYTSVLTYFITAYFLLPFKLCSSRAGPGLELASRPPLAEP